MITTVIFDLDGTLLDTAPDIANALNQVLIENGRKPLPLRQLCPHIALGATAMVEYAFSLEHGHGAIEPLRERSLELYQDRLAVDTRVFPGMATVLNVLESNGIDWGVCTNKATRFTTPVLAAFGLDTRARAIVCGDTLPVCKPRPEPLWHALDQCGHARADTSLFVGDAITDIEAGRAAGMQTVAALYGYLQPHEHAHNWPADFFINQPGDILRLPGIRNRAVP